MGRKIAGVVVGVLAALIVQAVINWASGLAFPTPRVDPFDRAAVAASFAMRPFGLVVLTAISFFVGALAGAWAGVTIARARWAAWPPAILMLLFAALLVFAYPHPPWAILLSLAGPLLGGYLAARFAPAHSAKRDPIDAI